MEVNALKCRQHPSEDIILLNLQGGHGSPYLLCPFCVCELVSLKQAMDLVPLKEVIGDHFVDVWRILRGMVPNAKQGNEELLQTLNKEALRASIEALFQGIKTNVVNIIDVNKLEVLQKLDSAFEFQSKAAQIVDLDQLKAAVTDLLNKKNTQNALKHFSEMESRHDEAKQTLEQAQSLISGQIQWIQQELYSVSEQKVNENAIQKHISSVSRDLENLLNGFVKDMSSSEKQLKELDEQLQWLGTGEMNLNRVERLLSNRDSNLLEIKIAQAIKKNQFYIPNEYSYDKNLDAFVCRKEGSPLLAFIDLPLTPCLYNLSFRVRVLETGVWLGICERETAVIREHKLHSKIFSNSNGYLLLGSNGYSFSSMDASAHLKYTKLNYRAGAIIKITLSDSKINIAIPGEESLDLLFQPRKGYTYAPCFLLSSDKAGVQFLEPVEPTFTPQIEEKVHVSKQQEQNLQEL